MMFGISLFPHTFFGGFILLIQEGCRHLPVGIRSHLVLTIPGDAVSCRHVLAGEAHGQQAGLGIWVVQDVFGELGDVNGGHHGKPKADINSSRFLQQTLKPTSQKTTKLVLKNKHLGNIWTTHPTRRYNR